MNIESTSDLVARQMRVLAEMPRRAPLRRLDRPGVASYYELTYASVPGFRPLSLDLHVPNGDGLFPVVVWVHGGGWLVGDRSMGRAAEIAQRGFAVAAVDYRLSGEARFPAQLHDLKAARTVVASQR